MSAKPDVEQVVRNYLGVNNINENIRMREITLSIHKYVVIIDRPLHRA